MAQENEMQYVGHVTVCTARHRSWGKLWNALVPNGYWLYILLWEFIASHWIQIVKSNPFPIVFYSFLQVNITQTHCWWSRRPSCTWWRPGRRQLWAGWSQTPRWRRPPTSWPTPTRTTVSKPDKIVKENETAKVREWPDNCGKLATNLHAISNQLRKMDKF